MKKYIVIDAKDNVMVALEDIHTGDIINDILINEQINKGHKIAIKNILAGEDIIKYGYPIGVAKTNINKGDWVHVHNVITKLGDTTDLVHGNNHLEKILTEKMENKIKVNVYRRNNQKVGIRNELWIIPTVGCVNGQAELLAQTFAKSHSLKDNYDGIFAFKHPYGCSQMGDDHLNTRQALQNIVLHPNCGGVLVLGLGCENNQVSDFEKTLGDYDHQRVKFLVAQNVSDEIAEGLKLLNELYENMQNDKRTLEDLANINIGLKCGGSDGLSGITANPLIGKVTDYIVNHGGTAVLTEIPEMFGAENILLKRCKDNQVYNSFVDCINDFKEYYRKNNQVIYENPSPGNKAGGITTLEDKSLGCVQKGGKAQIVDVLKNTERLKNKGLNIISAPGNDLVATTTLGMCGCQLVLFSTGRGTPFGGFIPTIKISTNTELFLKKENWIDFNSGNLNSTNYDTILHNFIEFIIQVIEGKLVKNEMNNSRDIAIFKTGVTL